MTTAVAMISRTSPEVLTIKEVATVLRCSKAHVQNLLAGKVRGTRPLPFIPAGRRKLIRRDSLLRWMQEAEVESQMLTSSTCQNSAPTAQESDS